MAILVLVPQADDLPCPRLVRLLAPTTPVTINLDRIDNGATITLTYNLKSRDIDDDDEVDPDSLISVVDGDGSQRRCDGLSFRYWDNRVPNAAAHDTTDIERDIDYRR